MLNTVTSSIGQPLHSVHMDNSGQWLDFQTGDFVHAYVYDWAANAISTDLLPGDPDFFFGGHGSSGHGITISQGGTGLLPDSGTREPTPRHTAHRC